MDNVVQNINIEDIIPNNFNPSNEELRKIDELAILIKQFGLLEPILVRPKNGKYEIILGMDKYQAALIAKQNTIPVIVKEVDDEIYLKYSNIDSNNQESLTSLPKETFSKRNINSDIINLKELSKINLEYERDDLKMNNGQFNNDMINNNFNQLNMNSQNQEPTFGGRFFPSLEDEPTNMNMMGSLNQFQTPPSMPNNQELNNNLIDLTDLSVEKEVATPTINGFNANSMNMSSYEVTPNLNFNQPQNNFGIPSPEAPILQPTENVINLDNLQNNNPMVQSMETPNVSMDILNEDFGAPQQPITPQFEIPTPSFDIPQNQDFQMPTAPIQPEFRMNEPIMPQVPPMDYPQTIPNFENIQNVAPSFDIPQNQDFQMPQAPIQPEFGMNEPIMPQVPPMDYPQTIPSFENQEMQSSINTIETKDVTPVTNTIKNLVASLEAFGYKINITEENLPNMDKLIIEVNK